MPNKKKKSGTQMPQHGSTVTGPPKSRDATTEPEHRAPLAQKPADQKTDSKHTTVSAQGGILERAAEHADPQISDTGRSEQLKSWSSSGPSASTSTGRGLSWAAIVSKSGTPQLAAVNLGETATKLETMHIVGRSEEQTLKSQPAETGPAAKDVEQKGMSARSGQPGQVNLPKNVPSALSVHGGSQEAGDALASIAMVEKTVNPGPSIGEHKPEEQDKQIMNRPLENRGYGTSTIGREINLVANHYPLKIVLRGQKLFCYRLSVTASRDGREIPKLSPLMKRQVMNAFRAENPRDIFGMQEGKGFAYNKADEIFTGSELNGFTDEKQTFLFDTHLGEDPRAYECSVTLEFVYKVTMEAVLEAFKSGDFGGLSMEDFLRPVDTILRQAYLATRETEEIGRSLFIPQEYVDLRFGCRAITKLVASARPSTAAFGLAAVLLTSGAVFYREQPVFAFLDDTFRMRVIPGDTRDCANFSFSEDWIRKVDDVIKGVKVDVPTQNIDSTGIKTTYQKTYTIRGLTRRGANEEAFMYTPAGKQPQEISVLDYYQSILRKPVNYRKLQCLEMVNGSKIPMEFCKVKKNQQPVDRLASIIAPEMVKHYALKAPHRMDHIHNARMMLDAGNSVLSSFGLALGDRVNFTGRVLPSPKVAQAGNTLQVQKGTWKADREPVEKAVPLRNWMLVYLGYEVTPRDNFVRMLQKAGRKMGIEIYNPANGSDRGPGEAVDDKELEAFLSSKRDVLKDIQLIIFIADVTSHHHDRIKALCDVQFCVRNQVLKRQTAEKTGCLPNLLRKINVKLGGVNHKFERPSFLDSKRVMVIGADVTHPKGAGQRKRPSLAAVVANISDDFLIYNAEMFAQIGERGKLQEMIMGLEEMMRKLFKKYGSIPPESIYYFRDGVSDGQYAKVLLVEYNAIVRAFYEKYQKEAKITFIVVTKRHSTRLACKDYEDMVGDAGNVPPGTVADYGLCSDITFDFYMVSHFGLQGTSKPAHYVVLRDDNESTADQLQELAHSLAFGYQRSTGSVSLPTPVYYAHHVATRAKEILAGEEFPELSSENEARVLAELERIQSKITVRVGGMYWL